MHYQTREKFTQFLEKLAVHYGSPTRNIREELTVIEPVSIQINETVMKSTEFLSQISLFPVRDMVGEIINVSVPGLIASRTNTSTTDRSPKMVGSVEGRNFTLVKTDYDTAIKYQTLDTWAMFPDFEARIAKVVNTQIALDRLTIGFNGTSAATATNGATNTLGQDVNKGWIYDLKTNKASNFIKDGAATGKIYVGTATGTDYKNLDQAVNSLIELIPMERRAGLAVLVGSEILSYRKDSLYGKYGDQPTEKLAMERLNVTFGGLPAWAPSMFPAKGIMVVNPANLQFYFQPSSMRSKYEDNAKRDQIERYNSQNECFRVGDLDACAMFDSDSIVLLGDDSVPTPTP